MKSTATLEGVKKAIFFPFTGEKWGTKLLIGSAITLVIYLPVAGIAAAITLAGYFGQIMKRTIVAEEDPQLPEWKDWGMLFLEGIRIAGASLLYLLPGILFMIGGYVLVMVLDLAIAISGTSMNTYSSVFPVTFVGNMAGMFGGFGLVWFGLLLLLVGSIFLPPALGNLIAKDKFEAAFRIKEWWPVFQANLGGYLLAISLAMGLYMLMIVASSSLYITVILCVLLPFAFCIELFLLGAVTFSLFAVSYRDGERKITRRGIEPAG